MSQHATRPFTSIFYISRSISVISQLYDTRSSDGMFSKGHLLVVRFTFTNSQSIVNVEIMLDVIFHATSPTVLRTKDLLISLLAAGRCCLPVCSGVY